MKRNRLFTSLAGTATAALLLTGCGGISDDDRESAEDAALEAVGGSGRVVEVDEGDDDETAAYNVEVALEDGRDVDVALDDDFGVLNQAEIDNQLSQSQGGGTGGTDDNSDDSTDDGLTTESPAPDDDVDDGTQGDVNDDTPLEGRIKQQAEDAALAEVGNGRVTESTYADRGEDHVYEVEVDRGNDDDVTVDLDRDFGVVRVDN